MVDVLQAAQLTIQDVESKFGLRAETDPAFFAEFDVPAVALSEYQKQVLDQAQANFKYLMAYPTQEELVKLVVLSPLLSAAGFYTSPFRSTTEQSIEIAVEDEQQVIRGRADVLVLNDNIWTTVIEAKGPRLGWYTGAPQTLVYMNSGKQASPTRYGLITNGSDFIFVKLQKDKKRYGFCEPFSLFRRGNDLYNVVSVLKAVSNL